MHRFQTVRGRILSARDEAEIEGALQRFLDSLLPSETGTLPPAAQEVLHADPSFVPLAAVTLRTEELTFGGPADKQEFLRMLALVYEDASRRIAHIHASRLQP